jgi:hypothetical protein
MPETNMVNISVNASTHRVQNLWSRSEIHIVSITWLLTPIYWIRLYQIKKVHSSEDRRAQ